jgi:hypothetical protein
VARQAPLHQPGERLDEDGMGIERLGPDVFDDAGLRRDVAEQQVDLVNRLEVIRDE